MPAVDVLDLKESLLLESQPVYAPIATIAGYGWKSVNGWSSQYDTAFPPTLVGVIPESEFRLCIDGINETVEAFFPCPPSYICGYTMCALTLGLSLLCVDPCTKEMESNLQEVLDHINQRDVYQRYGILWEISKPSMRWSPMIQLKRLEYYS